MKNFLLLPRKEKERDEDPSLRWKGCAWNDFQLKEGSARDLSFRRKWMDVLFVHAGGDGLDPSVILTSKSRLGGQYLVNLPEGFSRFCLEHKIRPNGRLRAVFCTSTSQDALGGWAGLILRLSQDGHGEVEAVGPIGIAKYLHALRHLVRWLHPKVIVTECDRMDTNDVIYEDDTITAIGLHCRSSMLSERKKHIVSREDGSPMAQPAPDFGISSEAPLRNSVLHERIKGFISQHQGNIDLKGKLFESKESLGSSYRMKDAELYSRDSGSLLWRHGNSDNPPSGTRLEDCLSMVGFSIWVKSLDTHLLFIDCRDIAMLSCLEAHHQLSRMKSGEKALSMIFHFTPHVVHTHQRYRQFFGSFPSTVRQIFFHENKPQCALGYLAALKTTSKLNIVSEENFPVPFCLGSDEKEAKNQVEKVIQRYTISTSPCGSGALVEQDSTCKLEFLDLSTIRKLLFEAKPNAGEELEQIRKNLKGTMTLGENGGCANHAVALALRQQLGGGNRLPLSLFEGKNSSSHPQPKASVVFLGTGCAEPSKYRASSGILLRMVCGSALLMDAGEGTWGQLVRYFGPTGAENTVNRLEAIWISHKHADHILGILSILAHRTIDSLLLVVCPQQVQDWLKETLPLQGLSCHLVHCEDLTNPCSPFLTPIFGRLGIKEWSSFRVVHCKQSYGMSVTHMDGWKLVYSGDTRPCSNLQKAAKGATLLIHEATFEQDLKSHALRKKHCTWQEALETALLADVGTLVLTHFSQRYPKVPMLEGPCHVLRKTLVAFDGLHLPISCSGNVPCLMEGMRWILDTNLDSHPT